MLFFFKFTYLIIKIISPLTYCSPSPILSTNLGHRLIKSLNAGLMRSGLSLFGSCRLNARLMARPTRKVRQNEAAENHR